MSRRYTPDTLHLIPNHTGVYIIHNEFLDMYYVGQAKRLGSRLKQHFTGRGNPDVYADFLMGHSFFIQYVVLSETAFKSLNELEHYYIDYYDGVRLGYNRQA